MSYIVLKVYFYVIFSTWASNKTHFLRALRRINNISEGRTWLIKIEFYSEKGTMKSSRTCSTTHFFCFRKLLFFNVKRKSCYTTYKKSTFHVVDVLLEWMQKVVHVFRHCFLCWNCSKMLPVNPLPFNGKWFRNTVSFYSFNV